MTFIRLLFSFAVVVLFLWFSAINFSLIDINLTPFPWKITIPLYLLVLICIFFGFFTGIILTILSKGLKRKK